MFKGDYHVSWRFILINSVSWVLIFALTVSESLFFYQVNDKPAPYRNIIVNDLFILTWLPVSIFLFAIIQKWYRNRRGWTSFSIKMIGVAIVLMGIVIGLESLIHYFDRLGGAQERQLADIYLQLISFRFHSNLVLYLGFAAVSVAFFAYTESKKHAEKEEALRKDLVEAQLGVLKEQMKPHFLFNSLHAISGLILKNQNEKAITVIAKLSDLLRDSLTMDNKQWISVSDELDFLKRYLEIYAMRFGDQLKYSFEMDPSIDTAQIPPMILQPLVENTLVHGIIPNDNQGEIAIIGKKDGGYIRLSVTDTSSNHRQIELSDNEGLGLGNTRKRLNSIYVQNFELKLSFDSDQNKTTAAIKIPFKIN